MENSKINKNIESIFTDIQIKLSNKICLENSFELANLKYISGVDLAYWVQDDNEFAVCNIVTIDFETLKVVEAKHCFDIIEVPYIAGFLSFRELPLILKTYQLLEITPDIIMFDGNGTLHYRNLGIATHASFYLKKPTIGVAKNYLKIDGVNFVMPDNIEGAYTDIVIKNKIYGRALRSHRYVKPIFISSGNWIDINTATNIVLRLIQKDSRLPIPTRYADIETHKWRKILKNYSSS